MVFGPRALERSSPFALYQQYTSFFFFLLNHPLAIGLLLLAAGTAVWDCTLPEPIGQCRDFTGSGRLASARGYGGLYFTDLVPPHPPMFAHAQRVMATTTHDVSYVFI